MRLGGSASPVAVMIASLLGLNFWAKELSSLAFVPSARFSALPPLPHGAYEGSARWISRPGGADRNPAHWLPRGAAKAETPMEAVGAGQRKPGARARARRTRP